MLRKLFVLAFLAGCPDEYEATTVDAHYDFLAGEGTEWKWGVPDCVIHMRDTNQRTADARWMKGMQVVRAGALSGRDTSEDFRRGFYIETGKLAIEAGEGLGAYAKRFYYDATGRQSEIVQQKQPTGRLLRTVFAYDERDRLVERVSDRESMTPLTERWTYAAIGAIETYVAESNARADRGYAVTRESSGRVTSVRHWSASGAKIYDYEYSTTTSRVTRAHVYNEGGAMPYDVDYEYGDEGRIIARTYAPTAQNEAGARTELVLAEIDQRTEVVERRELTANGFLRSRTIYDRSMNGDVHVTDDTNGDGEPNAVLDLRNECYGTSVPDFAQFFSPSIEIDGATPYRVVD